MNRTPRSKTIPHVRVAPPLLAELERAAEEDNRPVSALIRLILVEWAAQRIALKSAAGGESQ